jgi:esterase/lipase superfamily enzyme
MKAQLFFATNRNHLGNNQWKPEGYGTKFSSDGHYNLRFGELTIDVDQEIVSKYLSKKFKSGRTGDGEGLSGYFTNKVSDANIKAYEDQTAKSDQKIKFEENSSTRFFKNLKSHMNESSDVMIFIHGFNVSWEEAVGSAMAMECMVNRNLRQGESGTKVILYSWPSNGSMMPFAAYKSDRSDARDSAQSIARGILKLRDFLYRVRISSAKEFQPCGQSINLLCHSMGNYVFQNALKKIKGYSNSGQMPRIFDHIFMCAPDVNDNVFENDQPMFQIHELSNHISVYYNNGDTAMYISDMTKGNTQRLGHTGVARPQLIHNKIHQIDCSPIVKGLVEHSYYLWATVNNDITMTLDKIPFDDTIRQRKRLANNREWQLK